MSKTRRTAAAWIPALAYMAFIFVLSSQRSFPSMPGGFLAWDKFQHYLAYMVMGLLIYRAAAIRPVLRVSPYWHVLVIGALYAASDEFHQSLVPTREMSVLDWLADVIGLVVAVAVVYTYRKFRSDGGK